MPRFSFGSWAFVRGPFADDPVSFHRVLHKLTDEGYQGIELSAYPPHPTVEVYNHTHKRQRLRREVTDHGLAFSGLSPNLWAHKVVTVDDPTPYVEAFTAHLPFAADLGIGTIRVATNEPLGDVEPARAFDRAVTAFDRCARRAADHGIRVAWEFEPCFAIFAPDEVAALAKAVRDRGNANFGVLFDTSHARVCGGEFAFLDRLAGLVSHAHLADSDGTLNGYGTSTHLPLGRGELDFKRLLPRLQTEWWTVDLFGCPEAWDAVGECRKYLTDLAPSLP